MEGCLRWNFMPKSDGAVKIVMLEGTITETGNKNATGSDSSRVFGKLAPRPGLEPGTIRLTVECSTN